MNKHIQTPDLILKKLLRLIIVLFGVTIMSFIFVNLSPVDPSQALAQRIYTRPTARQIIQVRKELGLDKPLFIQYANWVKGAIKGDFGTSLISRKPVIQSIESAFAATFKIVIPAMIFSILFIVPISVLSATKKNGLFDKTIHVFGIIGISLPNYWIGFILLIAFAVTIPIFKISDFGSFKSLILPALSLSVPTSSAGIRVFRSAIISAYRCDFVTYAMAIGLPKMKINNMVIKYALPPIITLLAQSFGFLLAGSATVEAVFSWPGIGSLLIESIMGRDLTVINATVLIIAIIFVITNFVADLINTAISPNFSMGGKTKI